MATLASKAATDDFLVEHYNAIVQALRGVVGVTDDGQAYIDLGESNELRIDNSGTLIKNIGGEIYFQDVPTGGAWPLSRLGGESLQEELFYGIVGMQHLDGSTTADLIYLDAIYVPRDVAVDHFVVFDGQAGLQAICGVYDTSGTLLFDTGSFTQPTSSVNKKVSFDEYALSAGTYWIAWVGDDSVGSSLQLLGGSSFKSVAAGSFTLPASITIPGSATWATQRPCFTLGSVASPAFA